MSMRALATIADAHVVAPTIAPLPLSSAEHTASTGKLLQLESIRGLAAFAVVLHHAVQCFQPLLLYVPAHEVHWSLRWLAVSPLRVFFSGGFAVELFFVLSGFVLSYSFFKRGDPRLVLSGALRRYFRLALPVIASVLLVYVLMITGCIYAAQAGAIFPRSYLDVAYKFTPNLSRALVQGATATFRFEPTVTSYNSVLWAMKIEFAGSMLVYGLLACVGRSRRRWLAYGPAVVLVEYCGPQYANFIAGVVLCDLYVNWPAFREMKHPAGRVCAVLLCAAALYMGSYGRPGVCYPNAFFGLTTRWWAIGAALLIAGALLSPDVSRFLVKRPPVWLGKVSFSLYLTHLPVLASVAAFGYWRMRQGLGWSQINSFFAATAIAVGCSLSLAWVFYRTIEKPSLRFAKWFGDATIALLPRQRNEKAPDGSRAPLASGIGAGGN